MPYRSLCKRTRTWGSSTDVALARTQALARWLRSDILPIRNMCKSTCAMTRSWGSALRDPARRLGYAGLAQHSIMSAQRRETTGTKTRAEKETDAQMSPRDLNAVAATPGIKPVHQRCLAHKQELARWRCSNTPPALGSPNAEWDSHTMSPCPLRPYTARLQLSSCLMQHNFGTAAAKPRYPQAQTVYVHAH